jgi:hypothetical protein
VIGCGRISASHLLALGALQRRGALRVVALEMIMGVYESHRRGGARVDLPPAAREHPLVRWRREAQAAG